jgi:hypothetical protein
MLSRRRGVQPAARSEAEPAAVGGTDDVDAHAVDVDHPIVPGERAPADRADARVSDA